jgi:hypothetical protein
MDLLTSLLTTLVDGALDEEAELTLNERYNISTANFSQMNENDWGELWERAEQAKWFIDHLKEIKEKFQLLIDGQIAFREFQAWLGQEGYKGAEKIKKAEIDVAVARAKFGQTVIQEDYRLEKSNEQFAGETEQFKTLWDNRVIVALAKNLANINAQIAKMQGDPEFAAKLAQWKEEEDDKLKRATFALKYGPHGLSHPSLAPSNYSSQTSFSNQPSQFAQFAQFNQSTIPTQLPATARKAGTGGMTGRSSAKDSIKVAVDWSGDMAAKAKGFASRINRGFSRIGNFLTGQE